MSPGLFSATRTIAGKPAGARRRQASDQRLVAPEPVLLIDGEAVPARLPDQLDDEGVVEREPGVEQGAAVIHRPADPIFAH